jgi:hypothetical protein
MSHLHIITPQLPLTFDWVWLPSWQARDITASGREQLHAIGFTI